MTVMGQDDGYTVVSSYKTNQLGSFYRVNYQQLGEPAKFDGLFATYSKIDTIQIREIANIIENNRK